jgi:hypothetical protein
MKLVYVAILIAIAIAKREAPKESTYVEYEEWTYEPVESSSDKNKPKEETYV